MNHDIDDSRLAIDEGLEILLVAALAGNASTVRALLDVDPAAASRSIHVAAALGDSEAALSLLAADNSLASQRGGKRQWTPLFYTCSALYGRSDPAIVASRVLVASRLLELGANPNEEIESNESPGGFRSVLQAAVRDVASADLAGLLIDAKANLQPTGGAAGPILPLTDAVVGGSIACVARVLEAKPPPWHVREALELAIEHDNAEMATLLLAYGALPDHAGRAWGQHGSCLHAAILLRRDANMLEVLLEAGVDISVPDRDGRMAYAIAVRTGHRVAIDLLRNQGASDVELGDVDRLIAASVGLDRESAQRLLLATPGLKSQYRPTDHLMLCWAIRNGLHAAVPLLIDAGLDPNVADNHGETPLHLAVAAGNPETISALRAAGASSEARNFRGLAPFEEPAPDDELNEQNVVFERAVKAVIDGSLDELRGLLDARPGLVRARSPRSHRATLLHYVAANGVERQQTPPNAPAIAALLLERGAEVDADCAMYGGGSTTLMLTVTSTFPERAGLTGEIVRVLARGGAKVDGVDGTGGPMMGAIDARSRLGVKALVEAGATIKNIVFATAAGRVDLIERDLDDQRSLATEALIVAAKLGQMGAMATLIERGVDVNGDRAAGGQHAPADGITALHAAANSGEKDAVLYLLAHGADPALRDRAYRATPSGWAHHAGNVELAELIDAHQKPDV